MAKSRKAWTMTSAKSPKSTVPDSVKLELTTKTNDLIETVLKPKHVLPPNPDESFNYITDIGAKWNRNYFYLIATYACPGPNALAPSFESPFARMEYLDNGKFALSFMRHTGKWVGIFDALSVDECLKMIQDGMWFTP